MQLLNLTISNHKSIRDEATLSLALSAIRTLNPPEGTHWDDYLHRLAGIYGPNGSGKTNLLEAFRHMQSAITTLLPLGANALPYRPYDASKPTRYSIEFILDDMRYEYSLSRNVEGIAEESLRVARKRWNTIYSRDIHGAVTGLKGLPHVNMNELVLTRASLMGDPQVKPVRDALATGVSVFRVGAPSMEDAYLHIAKHLLSRRSGRRPWHYEHRAAHPPATSALHTAHARRQRGCGNLPCAGSPSPSRVPLRGARSPPHGALSIFGEHHVAGARSRSR